MPKVLVSASAFGFGPSGKLDAICSELTRRSYECHFVGRSTALAFASANAATYASITRVEAPTQLSETHCDEVDIVLTVMDSSLPAWARAWGIPCVYVDSLFWMWNWPADDRQRLASVISEIDGLTSPVAALDLITGLPFHAAQYVAHNLSTVSCVQNAPGVDERIPEMIDPGRFRRVSAIVDVSCLEQKRRDVWLATGSGMLNPFRSIEAAAEWVTIVSGMLDEAAEAVGIAEPIILTGNANVLSRVGHSSSRVRLTALDHRAMLQTMNRAIGCLAPPGLTTILECAAYGVPVVLLPEQHYAHTANFHRFADSHPNAYPHGLMNDGPDRRTGKHLEETIAIGEELRDHAERRNDVWRRMVFGLAEGMNEVRRRREQLLVAQQQAVEDVIGGYSGVAEVVSYVDELVARR